MLKAYVDSQKFSSTTEIMDAMREMLPALPGPVLLVRMFRSRYLLYCLGLRASQYFPSPVSLVPLCLPALDTVSRGRGP